MAAIGASDLTYTLQTGTQALTSGSKQEAVYKITFGDGALTYPTGGLPLTKAKLGLPVTIEELHVMSSTDGYVYKFDRENQKIMMFYADYDAVADGALIQVANSVAPAATTLYVKVVGW